MTILFDWSKILKASNKKVAHIVTILDLITFKRKPRNKYDSRMLFYGKDFSGNSYLLNPNDLLKYKNNYSNQEIAQYVALASLRNYAQYLVTGNVRLKLIFSPTSKAKIQANRLLDVEEDEIVFLYEEVAKERYNGN